MIRSETRNRKKRGTSGQVHLEAHHRPISAYSCPLRGDGLLFDMKMTPSRGPMRPHQRRLRERRDPKHEHSASCRRCICTSRNRRAERHERTTNHHAPIGGGKQDPGECGLSSSSLLLLLSVRLTDHLLALSPPTSSAWRTTRRCPSACCCGALRLPTCHPHRAPAVGVVVVGPCPSTVACWSASSSFAWAAAAW